MIEKYTKKTNLSRVFFFIISLCTSLFITQINPLKADAAVGNYNRNQATYYTSAFTNRVTPTTRGLPLLETLHELMYETHLTYNTYADLYEYTKYTDIDIDNPGNIILLYSRQSVDGIAAQATWNREHVWSQSLSGGLYGTDTGPGSDIHHLRPASTAYNSTRGNDPYGIVSNHNASTQFGTTDNYQSGGIFEPADYLKGDIARIIMYMYTHYSNEINGTATKSGNLNITSIVSTPTNTKQAAWDLLMDWHAADPVDYQEMYRNIQAAKYLGNFNPYIDHPEYAQMIWAQQESSQVGVSFQTSYVEIGVDADFSNPAVPVGNAITYEPIIYTSDNPSIASISPTGQISGVRDGIARIKARTTINNEPVITYAFVKVGAGYNPKNTMKANGIVYTPTSKTTAKASEQISNETVSFDNTYNTFSQLTSGNTATLTISNFPRTIKSIVLSMHSNQSSGKGSITITVGGSTYKAIPDSAFASFAGAYSQSYVPVDVTNPSAPIKTGTIEIKITASTNSLFFEKAIIDYEERVLTKATSIDITPSSHTLVPQEDISLNATFSPTNTTLKTLTWVSTNPTVATVNQYGLVRAVGLGSTSIIATAKDGSGVVGTSTIQVVNQLGGPIETPTVTSVTLMPTRLDLDLRGKKTGILTAIVQVTNDAPKVVNWTSQNTDIATVNSNGMVIAAAVGITTVTATSTIDPTKYAMATITVTDDAPVVTAITASPNKTFYVGDTITKNDVTVKDSLGNTINGFTFTNDQYQFTYNDASSGGALTSKTFNQAIVYQGLTTSLTVQVQRQTYISTINVSDTLDASFTGITANTYTSWSGKLGSSSGAVYAGHNAGSYSSIQLRSNESTGNIHSGIVSTSSGGKLTSVEVSWNTNTTNGRVLNVYGNHTPFTSVEDMYTDGSQSNLLGTIVMGSSTSLTIEGDYTYVGVRSNNGALYLNSLVFTYSNQNNSATKLAHYIMFEDIGNQCITKLEEAETRFNDLSTTERNMFMTSELYEIKTARDRFSAWALSQGKVINYHNGTYQIESMMVSRPEILGDTTGAQILQIVVITLLGLSLMGAYRYYQRKKQVK